MSDEDVEFPIGPMEFPPTHEAISLRDYLAAQALTGFLNQLGVLSKAATKDRVSATKLVAIAAYEIADAMLEQRKK